MKSTLKLEAQEFEQNFPHSPFVIKHSLASNPLFSFERLIELSQTLPEDCVEYNAGDLPVSQDPLTTPLNGLSVEETIRRIQECKSWLVLKYIERDEEYKHLLDSCLDEAMPYVQPALGETFKREGFIFISSPGSVTPYHSDPEHNFLLQVRGNKAVHLFDGNDRKIISEEELENFHNGGHRNLEFREEYQQKAMSFKLLPGDGLHFPVTAPHWVQNGNEVSVSFSITFRSSFSERKARLHQANAQIRKWGLKPSPVGTSSWKDLTKDTAFRIYRKANAFLSKENPY